MEWLWKFFRKDPEPEPPSAATDPASQVLLPSQPREYTTQGFLEHFEGDLVKSLSYAVPGHITIVRDLVAMGAPVTSDHYGGRSLLFKCLRGGESGITCARMLLDLGLDINEADPEGNCLLATYSIHPDLEWVKFVLENGGDVHHRGQFGNTALHVFARTSRMEVGIDFQGPYFYFSDENCIALGICELLIAAGAEIDARSDNSETPLLEAAGSLNMDVMRYLLKKGADPFAVTKDGEDAIALSRRAYDEFIEAPSSSGWHLEHSSKELAKDLATIRVMIEDARASRNPKT